MLTTFQQFSDWVRDNGFTHWALYTKDRTATGEEKLNGLVIDSNLYPPTMSIDDKLALTKKHLETFAGQRLFGQGWQNEKASNGGCYCEVRVDAYSQQQPASGVGVVPAGGQTIGELRDELTRDITARLQAEMRAEQAERDKKDFEKRVKEFEEKEQSVWGLVVNKLAPMAMAAVSGNRTASALRNVAGIDANEDVHAAQIIPTQQPAETEPMDDPEQQGAGDPDAECPFTDDEADKLFELCAAWKKADPDYLQLLEKVVQMAVNGDSNYNLAKKMI